MKECERKVIVWGGLEKRTLIVELNGKCRTECMTQEGYVLALHNGNQITG